MVHAEQREIRLCAQSWRGARFIAVHYRLDALEAIVAATFAVPALELRAGRRRSARVALARQCAMYLAHVVFGLSCAEVGRLFGRDRTTAAHACRVIEERREDPFLDAVLTALEATCSVVPRSLRDGKAVS